MINDVLNIVFPEDFPECNKNNNRNDSTWKGGDFIPVVDELCGVQGWQGRVDWP